jgi:type IV pilus assembly protein PilE
MRKFKNHGGFTLMELMIAVAIVAILASLAYPSYSDAMRKSHRNDGQAILMDLAGRQEVYYAKNATYTTKLSDLNATNKSPEGYYAVTIQAADATTYRLVATTKTKGGQNLDSVRKYRLHSSGKREFRGRSGGWKTGWSGH